MISNSHFFFCSFNYQVLRIRNCSFYYLLIFHQRFQGGSSNALKPCLFLKHLLTQKQSNQGRHGKIHLLCDEFSHFLSSFFIFFLITFRAIEDPQKTKILFKMRWIIKNLVIFIQFIGSNAMMMKYAREDFVSV